MRILVINPPLTASMNLRKIDKKGLTLHECYEPEIAIEILNRYHIDLVVVFMKLMEPAVFSTMKTLFRKNPGLKVVGLASREVSELMSEIDGLACWPIEAEPTPKLI